MGRIIDTWMVGRQIMLLVVLALFLAAGPATSSAHASTANWYAQGCSGPATDCYSLSTGKSQWNSLGQTVTAGAGFVQPNTNGTGPGGDCQTHSPACLGGQAPPAYVGLNVASVWGTYCRDYSYNAGAWIGPAANCGNTDTSSAEWTMKSGYGQGDTQCTCGVHFLPVFSNTSPAASLSPEQPFSSIYGNRSALIVKATQTNSSQGPDPFHAYVCFNLYAKYQGHLDWLENCDYGWRTTDLTSEKSGLACIGNAGVYVSNSFNGLPGDQIYGTNLGAAKNSQQNVAQTYAYSTSRAQLSQAISDFNQGKYPNTNSSVCVGAQLDPNPSDYHLEFLESGIENWQDTAGDAGGQTESGLSAYTSYR